MEVEVNKVISRYYMLKNKQREIENELQALKQDIVSHLQQSGTNETIVGGYKIKLVTTERKEFDEGLLYESLPDKEIWRLLSKPDISKINGLIKMGVITEKQVEHTFNIKPQLALYVDKK